MRGRERDEPHRAATPLELFFDLVIVVAVAIAAGALHHGVADDHIPESVLSYALTFFAIWWAWMSFTWFATAYDTDDVPYRVAVFVQMTGAIVIAAGVARAFEAGDWAVVTLGYVVMRLASVSLWFRAARSDPLHRPNSVRFGGGVAIVQLGWIALLAVPPELRLAGFVLLAAAELAVPIWAARATRLRWHSEHIAERYGLFTIIVLGESVLAGTLALSSAVDAGSLALDLDLAAAIAGALLLVFSMWWLYFERGTGDLLTSIGRSFEWGYGHYFIWAAAAAVGAGIAVAVDVATEHARIGSLEAGFAVAVPVAVYCLGIWFLHDVPRPMPTWRMALTPAAMGLVLLTPLTPAPVLLAGIVLAVLLGIRVASQPEARGTLASGPRR